MTDIKAFRSDFVQAVNGVLEKHLKGFEKGLKNMERLFRVPNTTPRPLNAELFGG
jgi:hypothetical protein